MFVVDHKRALITITVSFEDEWTGSSGSTPGPVTYRPLSRPKVPCSECEGEFLGKTRARKPGVEGVAFPVLCACLEDNADNTRHLSRYQLWNRDTV